MKRYDAGLRQSSSRVFAPRKPMLLVGLLRTTSLTLENLTIRGCNWLLIATCIMCFGAIENTNHLFIQCLIAMSTWNYCTTILGANIPPASVADFGMVGIETLDIFIGRLGPY